MSGPGAARYEDDKRDNKSREKDKVVTGELGGSKGPLPSERTGQRGGQRDVLSLSA